MTIDLSLKNTNLYAGCEIESVAGRLNLATEIAEAIELIAHNLEEDVLFNIPQRDVITLTGPMAVWAYLVVFHAAVHRFREVRYFDGRETVVIARYGAAPVTAAQE
jgi:hypothetical protein